MDGRIDAMNWEYIPILALVLVILKIVQVVLQIVREWRPKERRMTVSDIMTSEVITAGMDDTVGGIAKIFERHHVHHIPIVEGTRIVGVVSDRDVLKATSPYANTVGEDIRDCNTLKKKAHQLMTRKVVTICPTDDVKEAASTMLEHRFNCLPVLSNAGAVVGIVTKTDLTVCLVEHATLA